MTLKHCARTIACIMVAALGNGSAAAQSTLYNLPGSAASDRFGEPTRVAQDVDGDGMGDLIVGSRAGVTGNGYAQVISGSNGVVIHDLVSPVPGDWYGTAVAGLADINADGRAEFLVGAPLGGIGGAGQATVYSGRSGAPLYPLEGDAPGDHFGWSVAGLDDVDGDLVPDFAVGAVDDDNTGGSSGSVRVFSGANGVEIYTVNGTSALQLFGYSVAGIPDVTGDGMGEIAIGGPYMTGNSNQKSGVAVLVNGLTGTTLHTWTGFSPNDALGRAIAHAGDVDGDGTSDVIVGAPQPLGGKRGFARIFSGADGSLMWDFAGDSNGDLFGSAVAAAGDINGDTLDDVAIGAPGDDDNGSKSGSVRVISGQGGLAIFTQHGVAPGHEFGASLDGNVDINGDGTLDLVAASPGDPRAAAAAGSTQVLSTKSLPLSADDHLLSILAGAPLTMHVDVGPAHAGRTFLVYGSITGTQPGTPFGGLSLAVNADRYFKKTQKLNPGGNILPPTGQLDAAGLATTAFVQPRRSPQAWLVGRTFHHVVVVIDGSGTPVAVTNPWPVTMVP